MTLLAEGHASSVAAYNVKYSPNLGDGLIAECLESTLCALAPSLQVQSCDLAGRASYLRPQRNRRLLVRVLESAPPSLRTPMATLGLRTLIRSRLLRHYESAAAGARAVVIGGGNLFADHDLNFPMKIAAVAHVVREHRLPVFIHACGVSRGWSDSGRRLFRQALLGLDLRAVTVRDEASRRLWDSEMGALSGIAASVVPDPGLLASHVFQAPDAAQTAADGPRVGLGVMSAAELNYHGDGRWSAAELRRWYVGLAQDVVARGGRVVLFCNGNPDDRSELLRVREALVALVDSGAIEVRLPSSPGELCEAIRSVDAVIAHRLHAIIPAYSYGKAVFALRWDAKIDAFMSSVGLLSCIFDAPATPVAQLAERAVAGDQFRPRPERVSQELEAAQVSIARLAQGILDAVGSQDDLCVDAPTRAMASGLP